MRYGLRNKAMLAGASALFALLACEAILRIAKPAEIVGMANTPLIYRRDEVAGYRYVPNTSGRIHRHFDFDNIVVINSDGFYDIERPPAGDENRLRLVALGDSFTASLGVPFPQTWPQVLEKALRAGTDASIDVMNLGLDGTGTDAQLSILSDYLRGHTVDGVILAFYENDVPDMITARYYREIHNGYVLTYQTEKQRRVMKEWVDDHRPSRLARWAYDHVYLARGAMNALLNTTLLSGNFLRPFDVGDTGVVMHEEDLARARVYAAFETLARLRERMPVYVVPIPTKVDPRKSINVLAKAIPPELYEKVNVVDLAPLILQSVAEQGVDYNKLFWAHDWHLSEEGHRQFGLGLASVMRRDVAGMLKDAPARRSATE